MENLRNVYLEEAEDLFSKMEESLLLLEKSPEDASLIAEVFRSMHTLKGSSSMYGSTKVADFVHNLETIYDKVRGEEVLLDQRIIEITFKSLDHLKKIVQDPDISDPEDFKYHQKLTNDIVSLLESGSGVVVTKSTKASKSTYHISFTPKEDIFDDGTNPLLLVDELCDLGKSKVFCSIDQKVESPNYNPKSCYTTWDVILVVDTDENPIRDVFIFGEDNSKLSINKL
ncbi:MAG: Hpt domain-containing protein [Bacteroidota bacterium]